MLVSCNKKLGKTGWCQIMEYFDCHLKELELNYLNSVELLRILNVGMTGVETIRGQADKYSVKKQEG